MNSLTSVRIGEHINDQEEGDHKPSKKAEELELNLLEKSHSRFRKIFNFALIISDLDLFLIYKGDHPLANHAKYRCFSSTELLKRSNGLNCGGSGIRIPLLILFSYLIIKFCFMSIIQTSDLILIERHSFYSEIHNLTTSTASFDAHEGYFLLDLARKTLPNYYQTAFKHLLDSGNLHNSSFWSLSTNKTMLRMCLAFALFYSFIVVPRKCKRIPLDAANLRFMLDPIRETSRLNLVIKQHLSSISNEGSKGMLSSIQLIQPLDMIPYTFTARWYKSLCRYTKLLLIVNSYCTLTFQIAFYYALFESAKESLCIISSLEECGYPLVFSKRDVISFIELFVALGFAGFELVLMMVIIGSNCIGQLSLIRSLEDELNHCLMIMSNAITRYRESRAEHLSFKISQFTYFRRDSNSKRVDLFDPTRYLFENGHLKRQKDIELILLRTYVKLIVATDEIKSTARLVTRSFESFLVLVSLVVVLAFLSNIANGSETRLIQVVLLIIYWSLTNPVLFICAVVFSRTVKLEKIAWSILAELSVYQATILLRGSLRSYSSNESHIGVLARRWRKLVESFALSDIRNSISPFGMNLTYGHVLRMNFFVITIISLLRLF